MENLADEPRLAPSLGAVSNPGSGPASPKLNSPAHRKGLNLLDEVVSYGYIVRIDDNSKESAYFRSVLVLTLIIVHECLTYLYLSFI